MKFIRRYFLTGSLIVLPTIITIYLFLWLFNFLDGIFGRFINKYLMAHYGYKIPGLGIILGVIVIISTGFFVTHLISRSALSILEKNLIKFPVIKQIYPAAKQIINFLFTDAKANFKKVVLVEYPRKGMHSLGFLTNEASISFHKDINNKELVNIFIPSTPNPLTGYLIIVPREDVIIVDISVENALKMIISGGVINPAICT